MSAGLLGPIVARKRRENARRRRHLGASFSASRAAPGLDCVAALRRPRRSDGHPQDSVRVIAEVKFSSPSAGVIRARRQGEAVRIAEGYVGAGATAVSVLCDRQGFSGSPLELRRVAAAIAPVPVLFKEFVLDPIQIELAVQCGASMILLLVNIVDQPTLEALVDGCLDRGLEPVVEAATDAELERALDTRARVIGVNARDLTTFRMDRRRAARLVEKIPRTHVGVYMSGVTTGQDLRALSFGRADAALVGSALMREADPGGTLSDWRDVR